MGVQVDSSASEFSFFIESLTFSDGSQVPLDPGVTLIIVGPNSSGKSLALREIASQLESLGASNLQDVIKYVVKDAGFRLCGTQEQFAGWLRRRYPSNVSGGIEYFHVLGLGITPLQPLFHFTPQTVGSLHGVLAHRLDTQSRLALASQVSSVNYLDGAVRYIHHLQRDSQLADAISDIVWSAFNRRLIINFGGGPAVWFHIASEAPTRGETDRVSVEYLRELANQPKLDNEGDGIRSFVGSVLAVRVGAHPILLIDEPEAFLHAPQCRRLGSVLAGAASHDKRQVILATHSSDIVRGAMDASENVIVCRIVRDQGLNRVSVLGKSELQDLWSKPMLRSSVAIDGLFHSGVVVCEGDSDCRFYEALANSAEKKDTRPLDLYFVQGGGKGAIAALAQTYKALSVPTAVIGDLDLLRRKEEFLKLYQALGGDTQAIAALYSRVHSALNDRKPLVPVSELVSHFEAVLQRMKDTNQLTTTDRKQIRDDMEAASDWSEVKRYGISKLKGAELTAGKELLTQCRQTGLFLVPVGLLEGWWAEGPRDKAEWVARAIPRLGEAPAKFQEAFDFVMGVCDYLSGNKRSAATQE